jgi:hypothetical protein
MALWGKHQDRSAVSEASGVIAILPPRIPKKAKRSTRWRSQAHCNFVRSHACCACGSMAGIEVAHVRNGSGAGIAQKPDDWRTVSLCKHCHANQHRMGEKSFWRNVRPDPEALICEFIKASPKRHEIERVMKEREQCPTA